MALAAFTSCPLLQALQRLLLYWADEVLLVDHRCNHGGSKSSEEQDEDNAGRDMYNRRGHQLQPNEHKHKCDAILQKREQLHKLIDDEERCSQAKHCEDCRGVCQKEVWHLGHNSAYRIHCKENVADLKAHHDQEEHCGTRLNPMGHLTCTRCRCHVDGPIVPWLFFSIFISLPLQI